MGEEPSFLKKLRKRLYATKINPCAHSLHMNKRCIVLLILLACAQAPQITQPLPQPSPLQPVIAAPPIPKPPIYKSPSTHHSTSYKSKYPLTPSYPQTLHSTPSASSQ